MERDDTNWGSTWQGRPLFGSFIHVREACNHPFNRVCVRWNKHVNMKCVVDERDTSATCDMNNNEFVSVVVEYIT